MFLKFQKYVHKIRSDNVVLLSIFYCLLGNSHKHFRFLIRQYITEQGMQERHALQQPDLQYICKISGKNVSTNSTEFTLFFRQWIHLDPKDAASDYVGGEFCGNFTHIYGLFYLQQRVHVSHKIIGTVKNLSECSFQFTRCKYRREMAPQWPPSFYFQSEEMVCQWNFLYSLKNRID